MSNLVHLTAGPGLPPAGHWSCSPAVLTDEFVFLSGQPPYDLTTTQAVGGTIAQQFAAAWRAVETILTAAGCGVTDVVHVTLLLTNLDDYPVVDEAYRALFEPGHYPARVTYQVARLLDDAGVELSVVARRGASA